MKRTGFIALLLIAAGLGAWGGYKLSTVWPKTTSGPVGWNIGPKSGTETIGQLVDFRSAVKKIVPSVVSVDRLEKIQNYFNNEVSVAATGTGSGVIVSKEGYILTNNHVVENAEAVQVRLGDKRTFQAKVVGTDPRSDIAVIKIDAPNLQPAELGNSSELQVGEWVIAVGNPLGYDNTVSAGVVSSLKRTLSAGENQTILVDAIQTDAAINQGNSGGALCNSRGQVIGINSAIASMTGGSIGIGFAIPIDRARRVSDDIVKYGHVKYGVLGVETFSRPGMLKISSIRQELAQRVGAQPPEDGVVIRQVMAGSPAAGLGIQSLDVLTEVDGTKIVEPADFAIAMADKRPGDTVKVRYWSKGSVKNVTATLKEQQKE